MYCNTFAKTNDHASELYCVRGGGGGHRKHIVAGIQILTKREPEMTIPFKLLAVVTSLPVSNTSKKR